MPLTIIILLYGQLLLAFRARITNKGDEWGASKIPTKVKEKQTEKNCGLGAAPKSSIENQPRKRASDT